jgi:hypothetical protein
VSEPLAWQPGGARGADKRALKHGGQYLMCVRLAGTLTGGAPWLDWHVVEVQNDEEGFCLHSDGGWKWRWEDVTWCLPMECLKLPEK